MGSDWARETNRQLQNIYDICGKRAARIVSLARIFHHPPERYRNVLGHSEEMKQERKASIGGSIVETLYKKCGDNPEKAWNELMDDWECSQRAEAGVYLIPWGEIENKSSYKPEVPELDLRVSETRLD